MHDAGKVFKEKTISVPTREDQPTIQIVDSPVEPQMRRIDHISSSVTDFRDDLDEPGECADGDDVLNRTIECLCDCFEKTCFLHGKFEPLAFIGLAKTLFNGDSLTGSFDDGSFTLLKGKLISFLMRKVFVMLAMTRKQIDTLNNFVKAILVFVSDKRKRLQAHPRRILFHVRECEKRVDKRDALLDHRFEECQLVSLALDTALFGQNMSCHAWRG